jgi:hypothetical protein
MVKTWPKATRVSGVFGGRGLDDVWPGFSVAAFEKGTNDCKNLWSELNGTNRDADGLILWSVQHAGLAGGSSEWLGRRLGGQGDNGQREVAPDDMADYLMKRLMHHDEMELRGQPCLPIQKERGDRR